MTFRDLRIGMWTFFPHFRHRPPPSLTSCEFRTVSWAINSTDYDSEEESDTEAGVDDVTSQFCVRVLVATWARPFQTNSILCSRISNQSWKRIARS